MRRTRTRSALFVAGAIAGAIAGFLAGVLAAAALVSFAQTEVALELGQCRFGVADNGTFYQQDRYHKNYLTPRCASLGLAGRFAKFWTDASGRWGWRVALLVSENLEARDNIATFRDDENGRPPQMNICQHSAGDTRGCSNSFNGSGNLRGVSASLTRELGRVGPVSLAGEAGLLFFRSSFQSYARNLDCRDCANDPTYSTNERADFLSAPPDVFAGATVRYGPTYLALRRYESLGHRSLSLTDNSFTQIVAGVAIPL